MAVGNVGRELTPYTDGHTFLSRDAGTTWEEIMPGAFMFEFAASGTVFILVNDETPSDTVRYEKVLSGNFHRPSLTTADTRSTKGKTFGN